MGKVDGEIAGLRLKKKKRKKDHRWTKIYSNLELQCGALS